MVLRSLVLTLLVPVFLTGCGVVAAFIPPIEVGDVFGVDGQTITASFAEPSSALMTQVVSVAEKTTEREFEDAELDMKGFSLSSLDSKISLEPKVTVTAPHVDAVFPKSFSLNYLAADATVSDKVNGSAHLSTEQNIKVVFTLIEDSCKGLSCKYQYASGDALEGVLNIKTMNNEGQSLRKFVQIIRLQGNPSPNLGQLKVTLKVDSDPGMAGFTATFALRSAGTLIKLGG